MTDSDVPEMEVDFGIARLYLKGDSDTSFEELTEEFDKQLEQVVETVEGLKTFDYEMQEEYGQEDTRLPQSGTFS